MAENTKQASKRAQAKVVCGADTDCLVDIPGILKGIASKIHGVQFGVESALREGGDSSAAEGFGWLLDGVRDDLETVSEELDLHLDVIHGRGAGAVTGEE